MPTWVKVVLVIVLVGFVLLIGGAIVAARWVRAKGERLQEQGKVLVSEAEAFGRGNETEACVAESLRRLRTCPGFICETKVNVFLTTCLSVAKPTPGLCTGVPGPMQPLEGAKWQAAECQRRGYPGERCMRTMAALQGYCSR